MSLVHSPHSHLELLLQYVGADSRYTTAGNHAGIYIRSSIRLSDSTKQLKEATTALSYIKNFTSFVHSLDKETLKQEQKGSLTLKVYVSANTQYLRFSH
jgi:hypothetical protein